MNPTVINHEEEPLTKGTVVNTEEVPLSRGTVINTEEAHTSRGTVINTEEAPSSRGTVINTEEAPASYGTVINTEEDDQDDDHGIEELKRGDELPGGYMILRILSKSGGEARLFQVEKDGKIYAAKCYLREKAIKREVLDKLLESGHKNLPKIYELGSFNNKPFVIMEYYSQGSLEGQTLSAEEIEKRFVPDMNEALHELDRLGIIHRDIKPSNITRNADGSFVLMDFGISSVRKEKQSIIATQTGLTFVYAAPEALRDLWLVQSDYYSLGITIYELLTGVLPTDGMTEKELERYALTSKIPIPDSIPKKLSILIRGLTYKDISNRQDKNNPNNRWVYEQVSDWIAGKDIPEPGAGTMATAQPRDEGNLMPYEFRGKQYTDMRLLFIAMAKDWEEGKKIIGRELLVDYLRKAGLNTLASEAMDANDEGLTDAAYAKFLYENTPNMPKIFWKGEEYSETEYGAALLKALWQCKEIYTLDNIKKHALEILEALTEGVVYLFYETADREKSVEMLPLLTKAITLYNQTGQDEALAATLYRIAFCMTGKCLLNIAGNIYETEDAFLDDFEKRLMEETDENAFNEYCNQFLDMDKNDFPGNVLFTVWQEEVRKGKRA